MGAPPDGFRCQFTVTRVPATLFRTLTGGSGAVVPADTVAVSVAVAPAAFLATSVNVVDVVALTDIVVEPSRLRAVPLMVADMALVVCQVTRAVVAVSLVAVMVAVGAVVAGGYRGSVGRRRSGGISRHQRERRRRRGANSHRR